MSKLLVLYVFHEYNDNVKHFVEKCIFKDENIDFILISNSKDNNFEAPEYVKTLFRDNIGRDFGGWSYGLLTDNLYENYNILLDLSRDIWTYISMDYKIM